ncbi:MAG: C39 family peptidase, partial [Oscillospiraceae bacterium]|nr:C39 family peptidase [Oscillospiraceae bacterium]
MLTMLVAGFFVFSFNGYDYHQGEKSEGIITSPKVSVTTTTEQETTATTEDTATQTSADTTALKITKPPAKPVEKPIAKPPKAAKAPPAPVDSISLKVPYINQKAAGFPTGCEVVSATVLLRYYGVNVSVETVAQHIPEIPLYKENGKVYG